MSDTTNNDIMKNADGVPLKYEFRDGQKILVPAIEAVDRTGRSISGSSSSNAESAVKTPQYTSYKKTVADVIKSTDKFQFDRLRDDKQKYAMIANMVTSLSFDEGEPPLFTSSYVHGDPRGLEDILEDLIKEGKIILHTDGNFYTKKYAELNRLQDYRCDACSHVSHSEEEKRMHYFTHQARQRR